MCECVKRCRRPQGAYRLCLRPTVIHFRGTNENVAVPGSSSTNPSTVLIHHRNLQTTHRRNSSCLFPSRYWFNYRHVIIGSNLCYRTASNRRRFDARCKLIPRRWMQWLVQSFWECYSVDRLMAMGYFKIGRRYNLYEFDWTRGS
jgi:hypothetical protein